MAAPLIGMGAGMALGGLASAAGSIGGALIGSNANDPNAAYKAYNPVAAQRMLAQGQMSPILGQLGQFGQLGLQSGIGNQALMYGADSAINPFSRADKRRYRQLSGQERYIDNNIARLEGMLNQAGTKDDFRYAAAGVAPHLAKFQRQRDELSALQAQKSQNDMVRSMGLGDFSLLDAIRGKSDMFDPMQNVISEDVARASRASGTTGAYQAKLEADQLARQRQVGIGNLMNFLGAGQNQSNAGITAFGSQGNLGLGQLGMANQGALGQQSAIQNQAVLNQQAGQSLGQGIGQGVGQAGNLFFDYQMGNMIQNRMNNGSTGGGSVPTYLNPQTTAYNSLGGLSGYGGYS